MRLSLALIAKDEERTIGRVLGDCREVCDEMVVVDTGSTDGTVEVARAFGARVETFVWVDDFAAARNASFAHCTGDWVLWLDADDRLPRAVQERLRTDWRERLDRLDADAVAVPYHYSFRDGGDEVELAFPRERILRRAAGLRWEHAVHEVVDVPPGRTVTADDLWVEHRPLPERREQNRHRNLRILERRHAAGARDLRTLFYLGNELRDHGRWRDAAQAYADYLATAPVGWERYDAHLRRADVLARDGQPELAAREFLDAVGEDPSRAEALLRLGVLHYDAQRWAAAAPLLLAATAATAPTVGFVDPADYGYRPWDYLAVCLWRLGRLEEAWAALQRATPGNPDTERLAENARYVLRELGRG